MQTPVDDNPIRQKILLLLKKSDGMTVEALSGHLDITPMGVRQHLASLERKDLVMHNAVRQGVGRPGFIYMLSDRAERSFPKSYEKLALDILQGIETREGRDRVDELFNWRKEKILARKKDVISNGRPLSEKIRVMSELLEAEGYIADMSEDGRSYVLRQYNCPISAISKDYPEACKYELEMYKELLGQGIERTHCISNGSNMCEYRLPKA